MSMVYLKLNFQFCDNRNDRPKDKATDEIYVGSPVFNALSAHHLLRNAVSSKTPSIPSEQPGNIILKTICCRRNGVSPHCAPQSDGPPFFCLLAPVGCPPWRNTKLSARRAELSDMFHFWNKPPRWTPRQPPQQSLTATRYCDRSVRQEA